MFITSNSGISSTSKYGHDLVKLRLLIIQANHVMLLLYNEINQCKTHLER